MTDVSALEKAMRAASETVCGDHPFAYKAYHAHDADLVIAAYKAEVELKESHLTELENRNSFLFEENVKLRELAEKRKKACKAALDVITLYMKQPVVDGPPKPTDMRLGLEMMVAEKKLTAAIGGDQ